MEMFSLGNRDLISEINNGSIEPTSAIDAVVYAKEEELKIVFEELENEKFDEVIVFFWIYDEKKPIYVRRAELTDNYLLWKEDVNLRMQMKFMNAASVRFAIAVKSGDEYSCGYIRNKTVKNEELSYADRLVGKLYSNDKRADIAYWTEGGILSITNMDVNKFDDEFYCATLDGIKWEDNVFIGYVEAPHVDSELNVVMKSVTTKKECEWADIDVKLAGSTGVKNVYRISVDLSAGNGEQEDAYRLDCILDGHEFTIDADEDTLETEEIHTISCADGDFDVIAVHEKNDSFVLQLAEKIYPVMLSVVTAVYNTAPFLAEMINSVLMQKTDRLNKYIIGNENGDYTKRKYQKIFEFILVDDGSTDGSAEILDDYARMSDVIRVIHKGNGGVSSARNAGIEVARGKYINFADSDDKFSNNFISECLMFFENHYDDISMVTTPMKFFDAAKGDHWTNYKFTKDNKVVDLNEKPDTISVFCCSTFFKRTDVENHYFDLELINGEDIVYVNEILIKGMKKIGVVSSCQYNYRRRSVGEPSAINQMKDDARTYTDYLENVLERLMLMSLDEDNKVPKYIQHLVMGQLQWRYKEEDRGQKAISVLGEEGFNEYKQKMKSLLVYIDDDVILNQRKIWNETKYFILKNKYQKNAEYRFENNDIYLFLENSRIETSVGNSYIRLEFIKIFEDKAIIEGYAMNLESNIELVISVNDSDVSYTKLNRDMNKYSTDEISFFATVFRVDIPLEQNCREYNISFYGQVDDRRVLKKKIRYAKTMPIAESYRKSYFSNNGWTIRRENEGLTLYNQSYSLIDFEEEFTREVLKGTEKNKIEQIMELRKLAVCNMAFKNKKRKIWLISDRVNVAGDNGEAMFRYINKINDPEIDAYFIIDEDCDDFNRMQEFGKVVPRGTKQHYILHLIADFIVSSAGDEFVINPWTENKAEAEVVRDFLQRPQYIFLQHGVTKDDISGWLNRYNKNIVGFVCAAPREAQSILDYDYYYKPENVWLTGMPRHDRLYDNEKRQIVIMPTWRQSLSAKNGGINELKSDFTESHYFKFYNSLINNEKLLEAATQYRYTICFMPHPGVKRYGLKFFDKDRRVEFFDFDKNYCDVYAEASLVVTDYSSSVMDFALLRKPVVYCQFDKEDFFANHIYKPGYYDYEKDGFGEVTYDMNSLIDMIISYMQDECKVREPYGSRMDTFFAFHDNDNCERVYQHIKELG